MNSFCLEFYKYDTCECSVILGIRGYLSGIIVVSLPLQARMTKNIVTNLCKFVCKFVTILGKLPAGDWT